MSRLLAGLLFVAGCLDIDKIAACGRACHDDGRVMESYSDLSGCRCQKEDPVVNLATAEAEHYCSQCSQHCAPKATKNCSFNKSAWGAVTASCECGP